MLTLKCNANENSNQVEEQYEKRHACHFVVDDRYQQAK